MTKLEISLPDHLSDEAVYQLVDFLAELTVTLETKYFVQMRRHMENNTSPQRPACLTDNSLE